MSDLLPPAIPDAHADGAAARFGRLIAVGGGRGGVGKSLVAVNLAVYFAQLGKSVVLVDADAGGSNLHAHFGIGAGRIDPNIDDEGVEAFRRALVPTSVPGLSLLPAPHDAVTRAPELRGGRKTRWLAALRQLAPDYLVVDVGSGHGDFALDVMLAADIPIAVTVPEPPAVETTYRFVRAAFRRRLRRALGRDKLRLSLLERAYADLGMLPAPIDLVSRLSKAEKSLADLACGIAQGMRIQLVVNQTRVRPTPSSERG